VESPLFHVTQAADDWDRACDVYQRLFVRPILDGGFVAGRGGAAFTRVGDILLEAMVPDEGAQVLSRFVQRHGSHFHSLAWHVRGIDTLADRLRSRGARLVSIDGSAIPPGPVPTHGAFEAVHDERLREPAGWSSAVFSTHPRDTYGMYEFCQPSTKHALSQWMGAEPLAADPLRIVRGSHGTVVVESCQAAASFWSAVADATALGEAPDPVWNARSIWMRFGNDPGTIVEFAEPAGPGRAATTLEKAGGAMLQSFTFVVDDLASVRRHLSDQGFAIEVDTDDLVITDPASTIGARYGFASSAPATGRLGRRGGGGISP
ncbi:MAG: VOC family protein, partial [Acidimicrobiales bacterium]|nr:VOC family protein [Acidimicrobiales bacterium]